MSAAAGSVVVFGEGFGRRVWERGFFGHLLVLALPINYLIRPNSEGYSTDIGTAMEGDGH